MKQILFSILLIVSLQLFGQGSKTITTYPPKIVADDTAAIRKEQEAANKFVIDLVTKTSLKDFQVWMYENVSAKQMNEYSFQQLYNLFIQQKYYASKSKK
jgi:hypothetical protein